MTQMHDDELRAHFRQLREMDRAAVPPFRALWDRADARTATSSHQPQRAAWGIVAAAAVIVLALSFVLRRPRPVQTDVATISNWTSPTAGLLRTSAHELFAPSSILTSTLDGVTAPRLPRIGDQ